MVRLPKPKGTSEGEEAKETGDGESSNQRSRHGEGQISG